jgi:hypothetical protein
MLPDCRHAAPAGDPASTATAVVNETANGEAPMIDRRIRRAGNSVAVAFFVRAVPLICLISHSQLLRPKQPSPSK